MANINCTGELRIQKNGKEIVAKVDDTQSVPCIEFKLNNGNTIKLSAGDGGFMIDAIDGLSVNGNNILSILNEKLNSSEIFYDEVTSRGHYLLLPDHVLLCWGSVPKGSSGTVEVDLPYYPIETNYSIGWSIDSSLDTSQTFRGMGAWDKQTKSFKTRRFSTAGKDWLLIGKY